MNQRVSPNHLSSFGKTLRLVVSGATFSLFALLPATTFGAEADELMPVQIDRVTIGNKGCSKTATEIKVDESKFGFNIEFQDFTVPKGKDFSDQCEVYVEFKAPLRHSPKDLGFFFSDDLQTKAVIVGFRVAALAPNQGQIKESDWKKPSEMGSSCLPEFPGQKEASFILRISIRVVSGNSKLPVAVKSFTVTNLYVSPILPNSCGTEI